MINRVYFLNHSKIDFLFKQSSDTFVVNEEQLYDFSGEGEHLVLKIRKKNLTTWDMINLIAKHLNTKPKEIGYAGLKDKNALTTQYISINKKFENKIDCMDIDNIKILQKHYHNNKIRLGHLKSNRFFIRLKKVDKMSSLKITEALNIIKKEGFPNYFGFQRFGVDQDNHLKGEKIIHSKKIKFKKLDKFLINCYQSYLFNSWLNKRVEICKLLDSFGANDLKDTLPFYNLDMLKSQDIFFKLFDGDVCMHYPHGKAFVVDDALMELDRLKNQDIAITGALTSSKVMSSKKSAYLIEKEFLKDIDIAGSRRYAWVFAKDVEYNYKEDKAWFELSFTLPKGSYATTLIEEIAKQDIRGV